MLSEEGSRSRRRRSCQAGKIKVCVACKQLSSRVDDLNAIFRCREEYGHIAPNWDAPQAAFFFHEKATADDAAVSETLQERPLKRKRFPNQLSSKKNTLLSTNKKTTVENILNEQIEYSTLERLDATENSSAQRAAELRRYGVPFVWINVDIGATVGFVGRWITSQGELNTEAFKNDVANAKAPLLRYDTNFTESRPIREFGNVAEFVDNQWEQQDTSVYLHQWQFPLANASIANALLEACGPRPLSNLPGLDDDLLCSWLERAQNASALQYLFLGTTGTHSRLHLDPGGLDLLIAPLTGLKRFTLIHRDDAYLVRRLDTDHPYQDTVSSSIEYWETSPTLPLARKWCADIKPGQVLCMPEGTLHAVRNLEPCLSYHRFHLDRHNLSGFWRALVDGDSFGIRPAEILWNATHAEMLRLDALADNFTSDITHQADTNLLTLKALRDVIKALLGEFFGIDQEVSSHDQKEDHVRGSHFDWKSLLSDVENCLEYYAESCTFRSGEKKQKKKSVVNRISRHCRCEPDPRDEARARGESFDADTEIFPESSELEKSIQEGDVVAIRFYRKRQRARILQVVDQADMVKVHYLTYTSEYDEFVPISDCQPPIDTKCGDIQYFSPKPNDRCRVPWGSKRQVYNARVLQLYTGRAFLVHYLAIGREWDQWVVPRAILRKLQT